MQQENAKKRDRVKILAMHRYFDDILQKDIGVHQNTILKDVNASHTNGV
jgi:hypothetical protein